MKLLECRPRWIIFGPNDTGVSWIWGLCFQCPRCNLGHSIQFHPVIGPEIRDDAKTDMIEHPLFPGQPIWNRKEGETFETLTISPSILNRGCDWTITKGVMS